MMELLVPKNHYLSNKEEVYLKDLKEENRVFGAEGTYVVVYLG